MISNAITKPSRKFSFLIWIESSFNTYLFFIFLIILLYFIENLYFKVFQFKIYSRLIDYYLAFTDYQFRKVLN